MRGTFAGTISEDEILLRTINVTQNIKWSVYSKITRNDSFVLLYQNARCFNFFPRVFFASEDDWKSFQTLLDAKIQKGELKEQTSRPDFSLGTNIPRWSIILMVAGLVIPVVCFVIALIVMLVYQAGQ